ncbi:Uncharacterised protein [Mycobacteroides abscessus subsp. abscessus]|nr:Uncharacterised protein [Mycobacteroides abscessus subsp. abscessus]
MQAFTYFSPARTSRASASVIVTVLRLWIAHLASCVVTLVWLSSSHSPMPPMVTVISLGSQ